MHSEGSNAGLDGYKERHGQTLGIITDGGARRFQPSSPAIQAEQMNKIF